jgi:glycosyltransferase involved in cell wall biosynthesis
LAESFGLTIIEAMSMGKSIAVSNIEPFKEIVADSNAVSFFNPNSSKEITNKICELLSNHSLRQQLKTRSRKHILESFNSSKIIEQNIEFYKSII